MPRELPEGIGSKAPFLARLHLRRLHLRWLRTTTCLRWPLAVKPPGWETTSSTNGRREAGSNTPRSALSPRGHQLQPACTGRIRPNSPFSRQEAALPEHFIPEETTTTADAKAGRSNISMARGSSASDWVRRRDVMAEDPGHPKCPCGVKSFRIRDVSCHAAISRLGASCIESSSSVVAPGDPNRSGWIYGILVVPGACLALSMVSFVRFYSVG